MGRELKIALPASFGKGTLTDTMYCRFISYNLDAESCLSCTLQARNNLEHVLERAAMNITSGCKTVDELCKKAFVSGAIRFNGELCSRVISKIIKRREP